MADLGVSASVGLLVAIVSLIPPAGAGPLSVASPKEFCPPWTLEGTSLNPMSVGAASFRVAVTVDPVTLAVIVTDLDAETAVVVHVNPIVVCPAGTVAEAGQRQFVELDVRATE